MMRVCLLAVLSHWRSNPLQLFTLIAGLAIATALWSGVQAINAEARASYDSAAAMLNDGQYDQLVPKQGNAIPQELYVDLRRSGWLVSPIIEGSLENIKLIGIDGLTAPREFGSLAIDNLTSILRAEGPPVLLANSETAKLLKGIVEVHIDPAIASDMAVGDVGIVQKILGRNDLSRLLILPLQPMGQPKLASIAPELNLQSSRQAADMTQLTNSFHLNLTAFGLLSFAVGLFVVYSTIGLAFERRRALIRTLRSLGVPLRLLINVLLVEMVTLTLIGAFLGIILGYIIAGLLMPDVAATLRGLYGARVAGTLELRAEWWLSGFLICFVGSSAAFGGRLLYIWRMPILESVKPRAWATASSSRNRQLSFAAMILLTTALFLCIWGSGLSMAFATLACMLIGTAFALPVLILIILRFVHAQTMSPIHNWFWADTRHQLPGLSLALMALLLAVATNIGVSTMVSSFRLTFTSFLDQRLAPELFIEVDTPTESAELEAYLIQKNVEVLPLLSVSRQIAGQPVRLFGVRVSKTYIDNWIFLNAADEAWALVKAGEAVVINEQLARRAQLTIGDLIEISPGLRLSISAVVGDYGNPKGQVIVSEEIIRNLQPDIYASQFGVRSDSAFSLQKQIIADLGISPKRIIDQASIKAISMEVFERTFTVTRALNVLTLGVAGFSLLMSLLTLSDLRIPQLAPMWALGLTRRQLCWMELVRSLALSLIVYLCALPLGLALAWVLLKIVNVEAFGWTLPMYVFPWEYIKMAGYAFLAALLAASWPALQLMRTPPSNLLKVFANDP